MNCCCSKRTGSRRPWLMALGVLAIATGAPASDFFGNGWHRALHRASSSRVCYRHDDRVPRDKISLRAVAVAVALTMTLNDAMIYPRPIGPLDHLCKLTRRRCQVALNTRYLGLIRRECVELKLLTSGDRKKDVLTAAATIVRSGLQTRLVPPRMQAKGRNAPDKRTARLAPTPTLRAWPFRKLAIDRWI